MQTTEAMKATETAPQYLVLSQANSGTRMPDVMVRNIRPRGKIRNLAMGSRPRSDRETLRTAQVHQIQDALRLIHNFGQPFLRKIS